MRNKTNMGLRLVLICAFTLSMLYIIYSINEPESEIEVVYGGSNLPIDTQADTTLDTYQHFLEKMSTADDDWSYSVHIIYPGVVYDSSFLGTTSPTQGHADGWLAIYAPKSEAMGHNNTNDYEWRGDTMTLNPDVFHYLKIGDHVYRISKTTNIEIVNTLGTFK